MTARLCASILALATVSACQGRTLEVGLSGDSGAGAATDVDGSPAMYGGFVGAMACTLPSPVADAGAGQDAGAPLTPLVGTWTGFIETLPSSTGAMTLVFAQQADGSVTGTLAFGTAAPPTPPTSAGDVFPPGFNGQLADETYPYPGFAYAITNVSFDGTRLQLGIVANELWSTWCQLQTSYDWAPYKPGQCGCLPYWGGTGDNDASPGYCEIMAPGTTNPQQFPCALSVCHAYEPSETPCSCTSAGCTFEMQAPASTLDVQLTGSQLAGSISGLGVGALNVQLTLSP
jgi:hypothetical protein